MIFIFHFDSNNARRLLFILVNQIITVQFSLLHPPKIETLLHSVTQNSHKANHTHIEQKWSRGRELRDLREQKGEIRNRENASQLLDEMPSLLTLTLLATYRTLSSPTSSPFSQPETLSPQAFCRAGGGLSGLSSLLFTWTRENLHKIEIIVLQI